MTNKISIMVCVILILQSRLAQAVPEEPSGEQAAPENGSSDTESVEKAKPARFELEEELKRTKMGADLAERRHDPMISVGYG